MPWRIVRNLDRTELNKTPHTINNNSPHDLLLELKLRVSIVWVLVSSTGKVSDSCIKNMRFNFCLHQKLISLLV